MEVHAVYRGARISAFKARQLTREIQGLAASAALDLVAFSPKKAAFLVGKTLKSAIANAENNNELRIDALVVKEATVGEGPTSKRSKSSARGSSPLIRKRTSHIRIVLSDEIELPERFPVWTQPRRPKSQGFAGRHTAPVGTAHQPAAPEARGTEGFTRFSTPHSPETSMHAFAHIRVPKGTKHLETHQPYTLEVGMADELIQRRRRPSPIPASGAQALSYEVGVFSEDMDVSPQGRQSYTFSGASGGKSISFVLKPRTVGPKAVVVDMYQGGDWVANIRMRVQVAARATPTDADVVA